jgi:hypothetical protein
MNRRALIKSLLAAPLAMKAVSPVTPVGPFGFVDVDRWHRLGLIGSYGVFLDGVEVTGDSIWFDDVVGQVGQYAMLSDRHFQKDALGDPVIKVLTGEVTVRPVAPYGDPR